MRWSRGPQRDLPRTSSTDDLTGIELPGLSASPLDLEGWWGERPVRVWVARRLYDYCHLPHVKDARTRPWVLHGSETARGPDNEPLVTDIEPLGWIADQVITDACRNVTEQPGLWDSARPGRAFRPALAVPGAAAPGGRPSVTPVAGHEPQQPPTGASPAAVSAAAGASRSASAPPADQRFVIASSRAWSLRRRIRMLPSPPSAAASRRVIEVVTVAPAVGVVCRVPGSQRRRASSPGAPTMGG